MADEYERRNSLIRQLLEESSDDDYYDHPSIPKNEKLSDSETEDFVEEEYEESTDADDTDADETYRPKASDLVKCDYSSGSDIEVLPCKSKKRQKKTVSIVIAEHTLKRKRTSPTSNRVQSLPSTSSTSNDIHAATTSHDVPLSNIDSSTRNYPPSNNNSLPNDDALPTDDALPNGALPSDDNPDDPLPQDDLESNPDPHIFIPKSTFIRAPNKHLWSTRPPSASRTPSRNIVVSKRDVFGSAKNSILPLTCFLEIFDEPMLKKILKHTNERMDQLRMNYKDTKKSTVQPLGLEELKAFLGLLVNSAWSKDNHLAVRDMFDSDWSGSRYKCVMPSDRFDHILLSLRFDDRATRDERKLADPFAHIRQLWEAFTLNCRSKYKPGSYVTCDEQLLAFRGKCPFRMYIPNKPAKYGIKLVLCCDTTTSYVIDAIPYVGKKTPIKQMPVADFFVTELTRSIHGSNRSVTTDNWFTNITLAEKLLKAPFNLTTVGTIRLGRKGVPKELGNNREKPIQSSMFLFDKEKTLVSYKPKGNKVVTLLSTMHSGMSLNPETKKPEIIHTYNATKGAVDTLDKMCGDMSCSRKTQRWPLCVFFGMMNIAFVNSYVIYCMNNIRLGNRPLNRKEFMKQLCKELTEPQMRSRLEVQSLKRTTKTTIYEILGIQATPPVPREHGARKICAFCPAALRRMTTSYCIHCDKAICGQHRAMSCRECDNELVH